MKTEFIQLLQQTELEGMEKIVSNLERLGFFEAPASTRFHLSIPGGLVQHSISVCKAAINIRNIAIAEKPDLETKLPVRSVILVSLLHDICKAEIYKTTFRNVKNEQGIWEKVPAYETDYSHFPMGHGEKSVIRLMQWGVKLTKDEMLAIRWHMNAWDIPFQSYEALGNLNAAKEQCPLLTILQTADMLSSMIYED